jgi:hypothetical protein
MKDKRLDTRPRRRRPRSTEVPATHCQRCGTPLNMAISTTGHKPTPGTFTICCYCGCWHVFTEGLKLRRMLDYEYEWRIMTDPDMRAAEAFVRWKKEQEQGKP